MGQLTISYMCSHVPSSLLSAGVKLDPSKAWCPMLECQAVCSVQTSTEGQPISVRCLTCHAVFCSGCRGPWEDNHTCPQRQPMMFPSASDESRSAPHLLRNKHQQKETVHCSEAVVSMVCCGQRNREQLSSWFLTTAGSYFSARKVSWTHWVYINDAS